MARKHTEETILHLAHLNLRSIFTGFPDFCNLVRTRDFDIIGVTETWLRNNTATEIVSIPGYMFFRQDRAVGRGGGIGFYVKSELQCECIQFANQPTIPGFEYLWIRIKLCNKNTMAVGVLYRTGNNVLECVDVIDNLLPEILPVDNYIIALGDLNVNMFNIVNPVNQLFDSFGFSQIIDEPTRFGNQTATLLDPIFVSTRDVIDACGTCDASNISDHMLTFCDIKIQLPKKRAKFVTFRDFKSFDEQLFLDDLAHIQWDDLYYFRDIDDKINYISENLRELFSTHAPCRTVRVTKPPAPWLTAAIKHLMRERDNAKVRVKESNTLENRNYYKSLRNLTKSAIRREKVAYLAFIEGQHNARKLWKTLQDFQVYHTNRANCLPTTFADANRINDYFCSVFKKTDKCNAKIFYYNSNKYKENVEFTFTLVSPSVVYGSFNSIKSNAAGIDDLTLVMLKLCLPMIVNHVTHIINCCLEIGYFPQCWKRSVVTPVPKVKNPSSVNELRPISLLPVLSKVLERVVHLQASNFLRKNSLLPVHQSGFVEGRSTTSALFNITDNIVRALDEKQASMLVLLDYSKAFDLIDHDLLCAKLSYCGFDEISTAFFRSYLSNRSQVVRIKNSVSQPKDVISGVPQGSILGPLLFVLYTFDVFSVVSRSHLQAYADDTQLLLNFDPLHPENAAIDLNEDLERVVQFSVEHNLSINPGKTEVLLFCSEGLRNSLTGRLRIQIGTNVLGFSNCARNLGLHLDVHLRFHKHIQSLLQKSYIKMKLLYTNRYILNFKMRKKLCETLVLSIYNYCFIVYYPFLDLITKKRIQYVQNTCCRFVFSLRKYDSVSDRIKQIGWLKCDSMYKLYSLIFFKKILDSKEPVYLYNKIEFRADVHAVHSLNLRNNTTLTVPKHRTSLFQRGFSYCIVKMLNSVGLPIEDYSIYKLRREYKKQLLISN